MTARNLAGKRWLQALLLLAGLALVTYLIVQAGPAAVWAALRTAGHWVPVIAALEAMMATCDASAVRLLLGENGARVPARGWLRATGLAYGASVVLPAGRLTGEAIRAAALARHVGLGRATRACSRLQACALVGNGVISMLALTALLTLPHRPTILLLALSANGLGCAFLAFTVFYLVYNPRVGPWLRKHLAPLLPPLVEPLPDDAPDGATLPAILVCVGARLLQTLQYSVVVMAVGAASGLTIALSAQGIHLVGAALGDAIPGQMGATEGAYRGFAAVLGLAADPARAVAIALVMRSAQLCLSACGLLTGFAARPEAA